MTRNALVGLLMLGGAGYLGYWLGRRTCAGGGR
jgi:hypothetical protein